MNDEDIKKSLECCSTKLLSKCLECKITKNGCAEFLASQALALINRQQAEIERLNNCVKSEDEVRAIATETIRECTKIIKSEAIKEFAERFIDEECAYCSSESDEMIFFKKRFDNFLAEMVGGENA